MKKILFVLISIFFISAISSFAAEEAKPTEEKKPETVKEARICWSVGIEPRTFPADKLPTDEAARKFLNSVPPGPFWRLVTIIPPTVGDPKYRIVAEWSLGPFPYLCEVEVPKPAAKAEEKKK